MLSVIAASYLPEAAAITVGATAVALAAVCLFIKKLPKALPFCLLFCAGGMFAYCIIMSVYYAPLEVYDKGTYELSGTVISEGQPSYENTRYIVRVTDIDGESVDFKVRLTVSEDEGLDIYSDIRFTSKLKVPTDIDGLNYDNVNHLHSQGIAFTAFTQYEKIVRPLTYTRPWYAFLSDIRKALASSLASELGEKAGIARAVMLGDRSLLSFEQKQEFSKIGVSHLFAVSGLHLSVLLAAFMFVARKLSVNRYIAYGAAILLVIMFMEVTGFSVSVTRAGVMCIIILLGLMIFREADPQNSLGAAILLIMLFDPLCVLGVSMQMSVFSTLGLITVFDRMMPRSFFAKKPKQPQDEDEEEEPGKGKAALDLLSRIGLFTAKFITAGAVTCICANVFLQPIYAHSFGSISILAPLANILITLPAGAILILSILLSVFGLIPVVGVPVCFVLRFIDLLLIDYVSFVGGALSKIEWQSVGISGTSASAVTLFIVAAVTLWLSSNKRISGKATALCCVAVAAVCIVSHAVFGANNAVIRYWATNSSVALVVDVDGKNVQILKSGYYSDSFAEQYMCLDNCFEVCTVDGTLSVGKWEFTALYGESDGANAVVMTGENANILFVSNCDGTLAQKIANANTSYDIIFCRCTKNSVTYFLTNSRIAQKIVLSRTADAVVQTRDKLALLGYEVYDVNDTDGFCITVSPDGKYR